MSEQGLIDFLKCMCSGSGQKAAAKRLGISPQYLNDIIRKRREPGDKVLKALKLKKVISYRQVRK